MVPKYWEELTKIIFTLTYLLIDMDNYKWLYLNKISSFNTGLVVCLLELKQTYFYYEWPRLVTKPLQI